MSNTLSNDWQLNSYFDHIYVINLTDTPASGRKFAEKMLQATEDLRAVGCDHFERLAATYGVTDLTPDVWGRVDDNSFDRPPGAELDRQHQGQAGCLMSHYRVIQDAQAHGYSTILILEDDNGFGFLEKPHSGPVRVNREGAAAEFRQVMRELPEDWDMVYFNSVECGSNGLQWMQAKSPSYSEHLNRLQYGLLTNAIAIHDRAYPVILKALSKIDDPSKQFRPVDHEYALLHKELKAFTPKKPLAYQTSGQSAITGGVQSEPWNGTWTRGF